MRKDGVRFVAETTSVLIDGGSSAFVVLRDLTAQKRAEAQLRASEAEFRSGFDAHVAKPADPGNIERLLA